MSTTTIRSTRLVQAFVAFAAAMSLAGGLSALAANDAQAMPCADCTGQQTDTSSMPQQPFWR